MGAECKVRGVAWEQGSSQAEKIRCLEGQATETNSVASGLVPDGSLTTVAHKGRRYRVGFLKSRKF